MRERINIYDYAIRYGVLLILAIGNLWILYTLFTPLTVYPVAAILYFIKGATLTSSTTLTLTGQQIVLIPACIAGAAYYLLCILNLTTSMSLQTRFKSIVFLLGGFLIFNIARIVVLALIIETSVFDSVHRLTWYAGSTVLLIGLWFANVKIFSIKSIPGYSDILAIVQQIARKKRSIY